MCCVFFSLRMAVLLQKWEFKNIEVEFLKMSEKIWPPGLPDIGARKSWDFLILTVSASTMILHIWSWYCYSGTSVKQPPRGMALLGCLREVAAQWRYSWAILRQLDDWYNPNSELLVKSTQWLLSFSIMVSIYIYSFVLRFYGSVNPMGSCHAWSAYLTTLLLGRLSPLSSYM